MMNSDRIFMYNLLIFDVSQHYILTINTKYDIITLTSIAKHNNVVLWQRAYKRSAMRRPPSLTADCKSLSRFAIARSIEN